MGKSLVILGADFSENCIQQQTVSSTQTDAGGYYSSEDGHLVTGIDKIKSVSKIDVSGCEGVFFKSSSTNLQPCVLFVWDESGNFMGKCPNTSSIQPLAVGSLSFNLPLGAKYISYNYYNHYGQNNITIGLACTIMGY